MVINVTGIFLIYLLTAPLWAANAPSQSSLDTTGIHSWYWDQGRSDSALSLIIHHCQTQPLVSQSESLFVAKYLAVIYSSKPYSSNKEIALRGLDYMRQMLVINPKATLQDMYPGAEINNRFDSLQKATLPSPPKPSVPTVRQDSSRSHLKYWIAGAAAGAISLGGGIYFLSSVSGDPVKSKNPKPVNIEVVTPRD